MAKIISNDNESQENENTTFITDKIGEAYRYWSKYNKYVFIEAPTGSGKSYFITHYLYDFAYHNNQHIVMLVNRRILKDQMQKSVNEYNALMKIQRNTFYIFTYQEIEESLEYLHTLENLENFNYNEGWNCQKKINLIKKCYYIVCDEAHYFLQDAMFNPKTFYSFSFIINRIRESHNCVIFMTATPMHIKPYIEHKIFNHKGDNIKAFNHSLSNKTTNINVHLFDKVDDLIDIINDMKYKGKWLIFVNSKAIGKKISKGLREKFKDKIFIDADYIKYGHYKEREEVNKIIEEECSSKKILICTSVLDNGININDENLKNIVIITTNEIEFLQMLGRKRNPDKNTNLFLCTGNKSYFSYKKHTYYELYSMLKDYKVIQNKDILHFLNERYVQTETLINYYLQMKKKDRYYIYANPLAFEEIHNRYIFNFEMKSKMENDKYAFVKKQFDWLGIPYPESEEGFLVYYDTYSEEEVNQIVSKLEKIYDEIIIFHSEDDQLIELHKDLLYIVTRINHNFSKPNKCVTSINKALKEIPNCKEYEISKITDEENEQEEKIEYYELLKKGKSKINIKSEITLDRLKEIVENYADMDDECFEEITGLTVPKVVSKNPRILIPIINLKMKNINKLKLYMIKKQSGKELQVIRR